MAAIDRIDSFRVNYRANTNGPINLIAVLCYLIIGYAIWGALKQDEIDSKQETPGPL